MHPSDHWAPEDWDKPPSVADVRQLRAFTAQQAVGQGRVVAIPNADLLTREVGNALLKLLEEPPAGVRLALFGETDRMLATVRSRVQLRRIAGSGGAGNTASERLVRAYQNLAAFRHPAQTKKLLYLAPLLHSTVQTDTVLDTLLP